MKINFFKFDDPNFRWVQWPPGHIIYWEFSRWPRENIYSKIRLISLKNIKILLFYTLLNSNAVVSDRVTIFFLHIILFIDVFLSALESKWMHIIFVKLKNAFIIL